MSLTQVVIGTGPLCIIVSEEPPKIGMLARNKDGVLNIPRTEEDCLKSAQWFNNKLAIPYIDAPEGNLTINSEEILKQIVEGKFEEGWIFTLSMVTETKLILNPAK